MPLDSILFLEIIRISISQQILNFSVAAGTAAHTGGADIGNGGTREQGKGEGEQVNESEKPQDARRSAWKEERPRGPARRVV